MKSIIQDKKECEIWKDIIGYEGLYKISNFGRIKSLERYIKHSYYGKFRKICNKIMNPFNNGNNYLVITLIKNKNRKNFYIHRLVAEAFLENHNNKKVVNHKDFNSLNNNANNLEWCTTKENINYSRIRMQKPKSICKKTNTGKKYITLRNKKYRISIPKINIDKCFYNLNDAILFRNKEIKNLYG